jgi:hypothetical protein
MQIINNKCIRLTVNIMQIINNKCIRLTDHGFARRYTLSFHSVVSVGQYCFVTHGENYF